MGSINKDPFDAAASSIPTTVNVLLSRSFEPALFFDGDRFLEYLNVSYDEFDVITYSRSKAHSHPLKRVRRLIYGLKQTGCPPLKCEKKYCMNIHVKLFLCYRAGIRADAYIGSQNLTHGTNMNLMYKVQPNHVEPLLQFFNSLWNSL